MAPQDTTTATVVITNTNLTEPPQTTDTNIATGILTTVTKDTAEATTDDPRDEATESSETTGATEFQPPRITDTNFATEFQTSTATDPAEETTDYPRYQATEPSETTGTDPPEITKTDTQCIRLRRFLQRSADSTIYRCYVNRETGIYTSYNKVNINYNLRFYRQPRTR